MPLTIRHVHLEIGLGAVRRALNATACIREEFPLTGAVAGKISLICRLNVEVVLSL